MHEECQIEEHTFKGQSGMETCEGVSDFNQDKVTRSIQWLLYLIKEGEWFNKAASFITVESLNVALSRSYASLFWKETIKYTILGFCSAKLIVLSIKFIFKELLQCGKIVSRISWEWQNYEEAHKTSWPIVSISKSATVVEEQEMECIKWMGVCIKYDQ